jgi:two-component system LytT family response regulator
MAEHEEGSYTDGKEADRGASAQGDLYLTKLVLPTRDGSILVPHDSIAWMKADGSYSHVHRVNGDRLFVCRRLGELHAALPATRFFRCHHAHVINLIFVDELYRFGGFRVRLCTGDHVEVARQRWKTLLQLVRGF